MKKIRITHYYLDKDDKKYINLLLKENHLSIRALSRKSTASNTCLVATINGELKLSQKVAKILDDNLHTNYSQVFIKGLKHID